MLQEVVMRGRKPVPIEQRRLEGEDVSHRPLPEPVLAGGRALTLPVPIGLPPDAVPFWEDTVDKLCEVGIVDLVDEPALILLATQYARAMEARKVIEQKGLLAHGSQGQVVAHPAVAIEQKAMSMFLKYAEHFALTPVARTRLGLASLHARTMAAELADQLGGGGEQEDPPGPPIPDAEVVEDSDVGLPGV